MPALPLRQFRILAYLAGRPSATARDIAADLRMGRADAMNGLRLLAGKKMAEAGPATYPLSFAITSEGRAVLKAEQEA